MKQIKHLPLVTIIGALFVVLALFVFRVAAQDISFHPDDTGATLVASNSPFATSPQ